MQAVKEMAFAGFRTEYGLDEEVFHFFEVYKGVPVSSS